jgi:hypothetical protein
MAFPGMGPAGLFAAEGHSFRPVPLIHQTDLFRPHADPDDHFDLACVYALAHRGAINLLGVLGDFPPSAHYGDPDVAAVAMLNHLTGLAAPLVVGMPNGPASRHDLMETASARDLGGVHWLLKMLRESVEPAVITVVGSCKDVALAARRDPQLFARKCRAIYLNAGTGTPSPQSDDQREYNVELDPASYASMFDVPCPLYWMPCLEQLKAGQPLSLVVRPHGTYYQFPMREVLPHLAPPMQRFFLSMLDCEPATDWLRSLRAPVDAGRLDDWGKQARNMWCTAGFLHLAGLLMPSTPSLSQIGQAHQPAPYRFVQVQIECDDQGRTHWQPGGSPPARCKFEVTDCANYAKAMTGALKELISPVGA